MPTQRLTVTIRPSGARTEVTGLPWTGSARDNYLVLEEAIGASRWGQVKYANGRWSVARDHTPSLIEALAERFGSVLVIQHGGQERCVEACWDKGEPHRRALCECSCAGRHHGDKTPPGRVVGHGRAGQIAVSPLPPHEYEVTRNTARW